MKAILALFAGFICLPSLGFSAEPERMLIANAGKAFPIYSSNKPGTRYDCLVTLSKPSMVKVVHEDDALFEVVFETPLKSCGLRGLVGGEISRTFIAKQDIIWEKNTKEDLPIIDPPTPKRDTAARPVDCLPVAQHKFIPDQVKSQGLTELVDYLRRNAAGIKTREEVDQYLRCYPLGKYGVQNYDKYKSCINIAESSFQLRDGADSLEVNSSMVACLIRRESGFDVAATPDTGIGQHTGINIKEISNRIKKPGSWERALWDKFFTNLQKNPECAAMAQACRGSAAPGAGPTFDTRADALCPMQSIAASSLYNLQIQRGLMKSSKQLGINWEDEPDYQSAIAAAYTLGDGMASRAVKNLFVGNWLPAIRKLASVNPKDENKVINHVRAVRNCLQKNNRQPMYHKDAPVCAEWRNGR